jgi:hypothetical protein
VNAEQPSLGEVVDIDLEQVARWRAEMVAAARRTGEARSIVAEDPAWVAAVLEWVERLPPGSEFSADRIRALFGASPSVGGIIARCRGAGLIRSTGFAVSESPTRHGGVLRTWERVAP